MYSHVHRFAFPPDLPLHEKALHLSALLEVDWQGALQRDQPYWLSVSKSGAVRFYSNTPDATAHFEDRIARLREAGKIC